MAAYEEDGYFETQGLKLYWCKAGHGPINLLFTSGTLGTTEDYDGQLRAFDHEKYTVVAWDAPGYGKSRPPDRQQEAARAKKDAVLAIELMKHLNLTPFIPIGWSEGARISVHIAHIGKPELVPKLVLYGAGCFVDGEALRVFMRELNNALLQGVYPNTAVSRDVGAWNEAQRQKYIKIYGEEYFKKQWEDVCDLVRMHYEQMGGRYPADFVLRSIKQPTLLMEGTLDKLSAAKYLGERIPNSKVMRKPGGTHQLHESHADWFNKTIQDFVESN